ncbi:hypothetical protein NC651_031503 [Populus alba x Populus x berolinensis]|nr:hypothetical protein NC651_031503 [Populus alba x Populus x berolinensis]
MDIEQKQAELIDHFVNQASTLKASALCPLIIEATSHPSLFAFSEILSSPTVSELEGTENSFCLDVLRLFAHGTWSDYKSNDGRLPQLVPDQVLKLKQLTVLTLAEMNKVLPYDQLMQELDVTNVRELEDFLINECMYAGIVRGKLDQLRRCFEVQFAAGRDLRPGQLGNMLQTLSNWLETSDDLLVSIQEKIKWADSTSELDKKHQKDVEYRVEEVKKSLSLKADIDFRGHEEIYSEPGGVMDYEEDRSRPKSVKIADFGLGEILSQFLDPNDFVGTIRYTSPERIDCGKCDEYAGDIWSFGLGILEFYPGRFPIEVETRDYLTRLVFAICMSAPPEAPPCASTEFRDFITRCLQREPERRWECSAELLQHPFILQKQPNALIFSV